MTSSYEMLNRLYNVLSCPENYAQNNNNGKTIAAISTMIRFTEIQNTRL